MTKRANILSWAVLILHLVGIPCVVLAFLGKIPMQIGVGLAALTAVLWCLGAAWFRELTHWPAWIFRFMLIGSALTLIPVLLLTFHIGYDLWVVIFSGLALLALSPEGLMFGLMYYVNSSYGTVLYAVFYLIVLACILRVLALDLQQKQAAA